jgi:hypothetical protein
MSDGLYEALKGIYWEKDKTIINPSPKLTFWQKLKNKLKQIKL